MDTNRLKTFVIAAETENLREAAERLQYAQSTVTKHIQYMEQLTKTKLFTRQHQQVKLTAAGHFFYQKAQAMMALEQQTWQDLMNFNAGYTEELVIAAAPQIACSVLPQIIQQFKALYAHVQVRVDILPSNEVGEAVFQQQVGVGLSKMPSTRDIIEQVVAKEDIVEVYVHDDTNVIYLHAFTAYFASLQQQFPYAQFHQLNQTEAIKRFVEQGLGKAYLPYSVVANEVKQGRLFYRQVVWQVPAYSHTYVLTKYQHSLYDAFTQVVKHVYQAML